MSLHVFQCFDVNIFHHFSFFCKHYNTKVNRTRQRCRVFNVYCLFISLFVFTTLGYLFRVFLSKEFSLSSTMPHGCVLYPKCSGKNIIQLNF